MARPSLRAIPRSQELAWFITIPLAAAAVALLIPKAGLSHAPGDLWVAILYFGLLVVAQATVLYFEVQRHSFMLALAEIPLLLALFYVQSPAVLVTVRVLSVVAVQVYKRTGLVKCAFNAASVGLSTTVAALIVSFNRDHPPSDHLWWLILALAVAVADAITLFAVVGVISLVQGMPQLRNLARMATSVSLVGAVNITIGLVVLVVVGNDPWSVVLLTGLCAMLVVVYRSYAHFLGQHRVLSEIYELTRAMGGASRDGTLPDVLLVRVRELLQAEFATLWLPEQERYPELMLTAQVNAHGLLDVGNTPPQLRAVAMRDGATVAVGPRFGDPQLRAVLRETGVKDAIVVPLRSGSAVIGMLEVTGRLGDQRYFTGADIRLLETLAAQAAVAVENSRLVDRLRFDAYHDALTSLPNRRRVLALLEQAVSVRAPGEAVAVLMFDIDGLRDVNDSLGHDAGDRMVTEVGRRLREAAPAAAQVGRASSDEFAVILRLPDADEAVNLATSLRMALRQPLEVGGITLDVDVAVGISIHPDHGTEAEILLQRADLAAQSAKQFATPVHLFRPQLQARSAHRSGLAADLRRALDGDELSVYFQPKVALKDRRVVGVECLARWDHPAHGQVPPAEFVAVAEHTGQLGRLTDIVLNEGLRRARDWQDAGRPLPVAVNLSARTLLDPTFPQRVSELLTEHGVAPALLTLEITEDGVAGPPERPMSTVRRLHELGVRLAVDDFGAGSSSLAYLRRMPVQEVKIDRTVVQGLATEPGDLAIVRAIVDLARHFKLVAVAEGVESELTVSLLEELGCDVGQGFLFSRALPFERFEAWLAVQTEPVTFAPTQAGEPAAEVRRLRAVT